MRKGFIVMAVLLLLAAVVIPAAAQDSKPVEDPAENACYEGGAMWRDNGDGCPTEWHWKAGWFLAAYLSGKITLDEFPDEFVSVLPPPSDSTPIEYCRTFDEGYVVTVCISSTQSATLTIDGSLMGQLLFVNSEADCPETVNGLEFIGVDSTGDLLGSGILDEVGFDGSAVNNLGLRPIVCGYIDPYLLSII